MQHCIALDKFFTSHLLVSRLNSLNYFCSGHWHHSRQPNQQRWDRKAKAMKIVQMPQILKAYNSRMGGVDLFDNAMNNYRIRICGKKWYWPLLTNALDAAIVNAWKLHCILRKQSDLVASQKAGIDRSKNRVTEVKSSVIGKFDFSTNVAECSLRQSISTTKKIALNEVCSDGTDHGITKGNKPIRCRLCHKHTPFKSRNAM